MDNDFDLGYKISLQKFTSGDFEIYYQLVGDKKVMAMITERALPLEEARKDFVLRIENNHLHPSFGHYKVFEGENQQFIGYAKLEVKTGNLNEAELGYMLLPAFWGKGFGSAIAKYLVEKAKADKIAKRLIAIIDPNNIPSRKILLNNGFHSEEICEMDGLPGEVLAMELPSSEG